MLLDDADADVSVVLRPTLSSSARRKSTLGCASAALATFLDLLTDCSTILHVTGPFLLGTFPFPALQDACQACGSRHTYDWSGKTSTSGIPNPLHSLTPQIY